MKTLISIRTDKDVKKKAQKIAGELGLSLSAIINASLKQFVRSKEIYFSMSPKITPEFENFLGKIEKDIKGGENIAGPFTVAKKMDEYLDSI